MCQERANNPEYDKRQIIREALEQRETCEQLTNQAKGRLKVQLADQSSNTQEELALEAVQETCRRAMEAAERYDPRRSVRAWLHGILENVLHELIRRFRKRPSSLPSQDTYLRQRDALLNETETTIFFHDCYFRLRHEDREIIDMMLSGYNTSEMAHDFCISPGAVRVRLCRALQRLLHCLRGE